MKSECLVSQVFVPITDEMIYDHPEQIEGPLVPYAAGMECHEWIAIEINPDDSLAKVNSKRSAQKANQGPRLAYSAS